MPGPTSPGPVLACWGKPALPPVPSPLPQPQPQPWALLTPPAMCTPGIVRADPKLPEDALFSLPPPRPKNVIFEDEEKSKVRAQRRSLMAGARCCVQHGLLHPMSLPGGLSVPVRFGGMAQVDQEPMSLCLCHLLRIS